VLLFPAGDHGETGGAAVRRTPLVLVVNPDVPAKSVPDLITLPKQKPGQISLFHSPTPDLDRRFTWRPQCSRP
jgi:hypothetical protein